MFANPNFRAGKRPHEVVEKAPASSEEIVKHFAERRKRLQIVKSTTTPSGQIIDWIPAESQNPHGKMATPPPTPATRPSEPTQRRAFFELEDPRVERGPRGTVPVPRRDFSRLHVTDKLKDYPRKRAVDGRKLLGKDAARSPADPDPFGYLHATSSEFTTCYGCATFLNVWDPYCELSGDHSISQVGIQNYDNPALQSIEAGWSVCHDQFGDWSPHLFTYYTTNGYGGDGDYLGGYDQDHDGWKQYDQTIFPGALINGISQHGGSQDFIEIKYQFWQGDWWFQVQGIWIGYYPGSLFADPARPTETLADHGNWVGFWGEVYSARPDPENTTTDMGSGDFAERGWTWSAYQRNAHVQIDREGTMVDSNGANSVENSTMYDIQSHMQSGTNWGSYIWFGGPGKVSTPFHYVPQLGVTVILGGPDGTLVTIDANGHIKIVPNPGDPALREAIGNLSNAVQTDERQQSVIAVR